MNGLKIKQESTIELATDNTDFSLRINDILKNTDLHDASIHMTYGARVMHDISRFSHDFLLRAQAQEKDHVHQSLQKLIDVLNKVHINDLYNKPNILQRLPFIGHFFSTHYATLLYCEEATKHISLMGDMLEKAMRNLLRHVALLDQLYKHNQEFYQEITLYIEAGKKILQKAETDILPKLTRNAQDSPHSFAAQELKDFAERLHNFSIRIHDLEISRTITMQMTAQIRLIQATDNALIQKIQTSMLTTLPLWKNHMALALTLHGQRMANTIHQKVSESTAQMLKESTEALGHSVTETAKTLNTQSLAPDTLHKIHEKLISTIRATMDVVQEGQKQCDKAEKELQALTVQQKN